MELKITTGTLYPFETLIAIITQRLYWCHRWKWVQINPGRKAVSIYPCRCFCQHAGCSKPDNLEDVEGVMNADPKFISTASL
jgi:hypothetical protein